MPVYLYIVMFAFSILSFKISISFLFLFRSTSILFRFYLVLVLDFFLVLVLVFVNDCLFIFILVLVLFTKITLISIAPLQVHFYSEVLPTRHGYCVGVSHRSATGNCERRPKVPTWRLERESNPQLFGQ